MSFFDWFRKKEQGQKNNPSRGLAYTISSNTITGKDSTSFACVDMICSTFAILTSGIYNRSTREKVDGYFLSNLMKEPNIDDTHFQFFYVAAQDYFNGNIYWYKAKGSSGDIISLFRLDPNKVRVSRDIYHRKIFSYEGIQYTSEEVLHIPSRYGYNGLIGNSIFRECAKVFETAADIDEYVNSAFNNQIGDRLLIDISKEYPDATDEQIAQYANKLIAKYSGSRNAGKPYIKSDSVEITTLPGTKSADNKSSQLIENRKFQEGESAKIFEVPLMLLSGNVTVDLETIYTLFIENSIRPLATPIEESINKLIPLRDRDNYYFEFNYSSIMRTSLAARIASYQTQIINGILTPDEARRRENLPESKDGAGDTLFIPANLMPLTKDIIDSYMAGAKLKQQQVSLSEKDSAGIGDDKK